jgi:hypothetical protein
MSDTAGGYLIFLLVIVGVAVQVGLIALAVLWGTSGIRRELFELRLALNEDMARRD